MRTTSTTQVETDVLVIGGGAAGSRAALEAYAAGVRVVLITKGRFGAVGVRGAGATGSGAAVAAGLPGIGYAASSGLSQDAVLKLVLQAGLGTTWLRLAEIVVDEIPQAVQDLMALGLTFPGGVGLGGRQHGAAIMDVLHFAVRQSPIDLMENATALRLLLHEGECTGALIMLDDGGLCLLQAKATILATGGCGQLYRFNLNPSCVTGDGYALGYKAGATLANMEFSQAFLATVHPSFNILPWAVLGTNPELTNGDGQPFLERYLPSGIRKEVALGEHALHNPFTTRDTCSRYLDVAMAKEVLGGRGTPHGGLWLDLRHAQTLPGHLGEWLAYRGVRWDLAPIEVGICHQCSNGGFIIDEHGRTTVPGLYACGEQACGPHGADRLGGQMLAATQVFGKRAGRHAALRARRSPGSRMPLEIVPELPRWIVKREGGAPPWTWDTIRRELQEVTWQSLLVVRTEAGLLDLLARVDHLREKLTECRLRTTKEIASAIETEHLLTVAEMIARSALLRCESRGPHFREDHPHRDDAAWKRVVTIRRGENGMVLEPRCVDAGWEDHPADLGQQPWG